MSIKMTGLLFLFTSLFACNDSPQKPTVATKSPTLDQKIGEMILIGFRGTSAEEGSEIYQLIKDYHVGGVVLYSYDVPTKDSIQRNIESPAQLKALNQQLQNISPKKLIISIDEEGGRVSRLKTKQGFQDHQSHQTIGELNNPDSTRLWASNMAKELSQLGINMNFGPVLDLNINPESPVIGGIERSFSEDHEVVTANAKIFIEEHRKQNIACVPKHFPGHGSAKSDSHKGLTDITDTWTATEMQPYEKLIDEGYCDIIMTAHVYNEQLDTLPGTLSKKIIQGTLRDKLDWQKVIISDDMQMGAINNFCSFEESIERAIEAGVDILLLSNNSFQDGYDPKIAIKAIHHIQKLVQEGKVSEERINESYQRIMNLVGE